MAGHSDSISLDSAVETHSSFDVATYVATRAFNSAALPPGMPDWMEAAIDARASELRAVVGDSQILDELSETGAKEKRRKEADERVEAQVGLIVQQQQREREEWLKSSVTVAGSTMTGAEWQDLSKRLRDDEDFREKLTKLFLARGMSRDEAEARIERVAEVAEIAAIPESQRTDEQKLTMRNAEADPTFKQDVKDAKQMARNESVPAPTSQFKDSFTKVSDGVSADTPGAAPPQAERRVTATIDAGL